MKRLVVDASTLVSGVASRPGGGAPWLILADDYLVALARDSGADAIVTGDRDLLEHLGLKPRALDARAACRSWPA